MVPRSLAHTFTPIIKLLQFFFSLLGGHSSPMTEAERDQIDNDAQTVIKTCRETINRLRGEAQKQKVHPQVKEHRAIVIFLIDGYLKGIFFIWSFLDLLVVFICWNTTLMYATYYVVYIYTCTHVLNVSRLGKVDCVVYYYTIIYICHIIE